jgi:hypothetical protein
VSRAPSTGDDILRCDPGPPAKALLHIVDRRQIDDVEIAGPLASLRQREGENEEVILRLKDMIGLPNGCNAAAVLEPLLKLSYVHVAPDACVYRESIFAPAAAEHHSLGDCGNQTRPPRSNLPQPGPTTGKAELRINTLLDLALEQARGRLKIRVSVVQFHPWPPSNQKLRPANIKYLLSAGQKYRPPYFITL